MKWMSLLLLVVFSGCKSSGFSTSISLTMENAAVYSSNDKQSVTITVTR